MSKRDDVSRYYDSNAAVQKVVTYSFIVNIVGSIFTLFSSGTFFHFIILLQFIASFINILFSWLTNFIFFPNCVDWMKMLQFTVKCQLPRNVLKSNTILIHLNTNLMTEKGREKISKDRRRSPVRSKHCTVNGFFTKASF